MLEKAGYVRLNGPEIHNKQGFRSFLRKKQIPDLVIVWGFVDFRHDLREWCQEHDIPIGFVELGWFPHYESFHMDPDGFCWESILPKQRFVEDSRFHIPDSVREILREGSTSPSQSPPPAFEKKYALWASQLLTDKVNTFGLNVPCWGVLIRHFRDLLPADTQLIIRPHPKMATRRSTEYAALTKLQQVVSTLPNTIIDGSGDIDTLIQHASCVVGANSTVLTEAALKYRKPVFAYGKSWYTNHPDLVVPLSTKDKELPPPPEIPTQKQTWFLTTLINKQILRSPYPTPEATRSWVERNIAVPGKSIPRQAHFIWLGNDPLPPLYKRNIQEFESLNPNIPTKLWTHWNIPEMPDIVKKKLESCPQPVQQTDVLRVWLLIHFGGMYLDSDTVFFRPLPDSIFRNGTFCSSNFRTPYEGGYMGASRDCPIMQTYLAHILETPADDKWNCFGPPMIHSLVKSGKIKIRPLPPWYFNVAACDRKKYLPFIDMEMPQRKSYSLVLLGGPSPDKQNPIGQHLHGSVNNQFQTKATV